MTTSSEDTGTPERILPGGPTTPPSRKLHRLPREEYGRPELPFHFVIDAIERRRLFASPRHAKLAFDCLCEGRLFTEAAPYAACLMPEHLHLIVAPTQTNLLDLVDAWKSYSTWLLHGAGLPRHIWQRSFWDGALRGEVALAEAVAYVLGNPARRGLVTDWREYPYTWLREDWR